MTTAFHTPGPWIWTSAYTLRPADPNPSTHAMHTLLVLEHTGLMFVGASLDAANRETDANQQLMATAPDLYDAAEAALAVLSTKRRAGLTSPESIALAKLQAALDKARAPFPNSFNHQEAA